MRESRTAGPPAFGERGLGSSPQKRHPFLFGLSSVLLVLVAAALLAASTYAAMAKESRKALVIGFKEYKDGGLRALPRAANDAELIADKLAGPNFQFKITRISDVKFAPDVKLVKDRKAFDEAFREFLRTVEP